MKKYRMVKSLNGRNEIMTTQIAGNCKDVRCNDYPLDSDKGDDSIVTFSDGQSACLSRALV